MHAKDQLGARAVDAARDVHHAVLAHRPAVEDDHVGAGIELCLDLLGGEARRLVVMLDKFAERLARHVDAAEQLVTGPPPSGDAAGEKGDIVIAELLQADRRALRQPIVGIAQHQARRPARDERIDAQLDAAQRQVAGKEEVTVTELAFLAHVDESQLGAVVEHRLQRRCWDE